MQQHPRASTVTLRTCLGRGIADRIRAMADAETRPTSNMIAVLLREALDAREREARG